MKERGRAPAGDYRRFLQEKVETLLLFLFSHGVRLNPHGTAVTVWTIVPAPDDR
jgi:hypothetical protein